MSKLPIRSVYLSLCLLFLSSGSSAQEKWTLGKCIGYALENNVEIKQASLSSKIRDISVSTAKNSRLPSLNSSLGHTNYFGRGPSRDGTYTDNNQMSSSLSLTAGLTVFSGFRTKHDIKSKVFDLQASLQDLEYAKDNVSLNITSLYLQTLLSKELVKMAEGQVELSEGLVRRSELLIQTGKGLKSELYESKALLANDKLTLVQRNNDRNTALLNLSQALNLKSDQNFDIADLEDDLLQGIPVDPNRDVEQVLAHALESRPNIQAEKLRLISSRYNLSVAKAARYPQISLNGGYSNSYYYSFVSGYNNVAFATQLKNNGNEYIGLSVSIPIFNRLATRNQIRTAQISVRIQELALFNVQNSLRKEIEQSHQNVAASYQKYLTSIESLEAAREAFRYTAELTTTGRATIYDYNDAKTRLEKSESEMIQSKYEFIFSRKILDFYRGVPLTE
ncbi:TolC family protein [Alistipes hominis]|uniref:TolC family protein n=1 Tax=Alistipes hominis TaxID=2763015 RepID=A0ABR7CPH0_9BACT|nr:TolC family protein [Alistipes hominis]MBC5617555.1 TolC family protein [Alistipes hominis]